MWRGVPNYCAHSSLETLYCAYAKYMPLQRLNIHIQKGHIVKFKQNTITVICGHLNAKQVTFNKLISQHVRIFMQDLI